MRELTGCGAGLVGKKTELATYRPFGEQDEFSFGLAANETKGFIGERYDADAGLQYLNARYYDPKLGLFLQPDWFEVMQAGVGTNRYSYSFNDPVNLSDPGGNQTGRDYPPTGGARGLLGGTRTVRESITIRDVAHRARVLVGNEVGAPGNAYSAPNVSGKTKVGVAPYETGRYDDLKARSVRGDGMDIDHIPSKASKIAQFEAEVGRRSLPEEKARISAEGTAVAVPKGAHQTSSPTFGGRNNPARIQADSTDPLGATIRDTQAMVDAAGPSLKEAAQKAAGWLIERVRIK